MLTIVLHLGKYNAIPSGNLTTCQALGKKIPSEDPQPTPYDKCSQFS